MARFQKGQTKPKNSGRKRGTPNKASTTVVEALGREGFDVTEEAIKLYRDVHISLELKFKVLSLLAEYSFMKPKGVAEAPPPEDPERPYADVPTHELVRRLKSGGT